jgi:hypothetical protein
VKKPSAKSDFTKIRWQRNGIDPMGIMQMIQAEQQQFANWEFVNNDEEYLITTGKFLTLS